MKKVKEEEIRHHDLLKILMMININDLINKMALVCYNLNRYVKMESQNNFYKYLVDIVNEYENNKDKYECIQGL